MEERKRRPWTREVRLGSLVLAVPRGSARSRRLDLHNQLVKRWSSQHPSSAMHCACVSRLASLWGANNTQRQQQRQLPCELVRLELLKALDTVTRTAAAATGRLQWSSEAALLLWSLLLTGRHVAAPAGGRSSAQAHQDVWLEQLECCG